MTQIEWDIPQTRSTIKRRRYHANKRGVRKHKSMQEDKGVDKTGDENTIRRHNDEEYPVIGQNEQLETETEGPQLTEQVCTMQDNESVDTNIMTRTEPTTPQIVTSVNNVNNPATSEPSSTIREGASNEQKHTYSRNRNKQIQYRNRHRKRKRDNLPSYNSQTHKNLRTSDGREIVDEEGANEINGSETIVAN